MIWIAIPVHNRLAYTAACLDSLREQSFQDFRVLVCDDGSTDGTAQRLARDYPEVVVLPGDGDLWWTGATNRCVEHALAQAGGESDFVLTLNNDLVVEPDYLACLMDAASRHLRAIISSCACDIATGRVVSPGHRLSWWTSKSRPVDPAKDHLPGEPDICRVTHAPGRGTLIPLRAFREIGTFDFEHLPHYAADYDFTLRAARAGYDILVSSRARVYSHVEATGMTVILRQGALAGFWRYLASVKSPANLRARFWLAVRNCPWPLLPTFLLMDAILIIGSFFRTFLRKAFK